MIKYSQVLLSILGLRKQVENDDYKEVGMNYDSRMQRVIDFIGQNLDDALTLDELSAVACFSKYHFHRLFTAYTGMSLQQYIKWLRLKRAAHQLVIARDDSIITIALKAGFESHEAFSRTFKKHCGQTPRDFRSKAQWHTWEKPPFLSPACGDSKMKVKLELCSAKRLAVVEHRGDPAKMPQSINQLIDWLQLQPADFSKPECQTYGIAYHDPDKVDPQDFEFDIGRVLPENFEFDESHTQVVEKFIPEGEFAVAEHKGSRFTLAETVDPLYRWVQAQGKELGHYPCLFRYDNFEHQVAESELRTQVMVLLKST